ncbi:putative palmitoyl-protein hydrolase [Helianthus annuus]|nr:putative palmitoyl-protein hydrolase [Helianthus annuus]
MCCLVLSSVYTVFHCSSDLLTFIIVLDFSYYYNILTTVADGAKMPSWFDIPEIPITANSPVDESSLLKAVQSVHSMIDKELAAGTDPKNVFLCGFSQGDADIVVSWYS